MLNSFPSFESDFCPDFFSKGSYPRVDIIKKPEKLIVKAEITGLKKEEVSVDLDGDVLVIKGEKQNKDEDKNKKHLYREIKRYSFQRSFILGNNIDKTGIKADFVDGILKVELPRVTVEKKQAEKVKIL
jgi:HSP20 family protein